MDHESPNLSQSQSSSKSSGISRVIDKKSHIIDIVDVGLAVLILLEEIKYESQCESPDLCNGLCCPTQYPTPAPHIMGFNLIDSCGRLREQLVLQGLFDILYCGNIIVNDLNNVCDCFNENVCFNENLSQSQSQSSSEFISSQQPPQSQSQSSKTFTITIPQNDRNWQLLTSLCGKGIISKKYSQKLKMPQDYPVEIKFNIGVHEIQLRDVDDCEEVSDVGVIFKVELLVCCVREPMDHVFKKRSIMDFSASLFSWLETQYLILA